MLVKLLFLASLAAPAFGLNNGLARTPQMGFNTWNHFGCSVSEKLVKATANVLISTGLASIGYTYVNLDDCWQVSRDANGTIVADPNRFPSGIAALADALHDQGLMLGLYSDAGTATCQGRPGSLNYEKQDAQTYADWKVDYLKYDNCNNNNIDPKVRYPIMRDALNATGRQIFYSMCEWGVEDPATWAVPVGNSWRSTGDISDKWESMLKNLDQNDKFWNYSGPGGWSDPDMLEVGNGGMTTIEYTSHFSLWALVKAPLIIGCDLTSMSYDTYTILRNQEVIAINQDPLGVQGHRVSAAGDQEVWAGPLANGDAAVVLFNRGSKDANITATFKQIGLAASKATVRDLWAFEDLGEFESEITLSMPSHGSRTLRIKPSS